MRPLLAGLLCLLAAGCATPPPSPLVARRLAYARLAGFLEAGMTRRQLYALLPPARPPMVMIPVQMPFSESVPIPARLELHRLDRDFSLSVAYQLPPGARLKPAPIARLGSIPSGRAISQNAIDQLLYGNLPTPVYKRSRENPDDLLFRRPVVMRSDSSAVPLP